MTTPEIYWVKNIEPTPPTYHHAKCEYKRKHPILVSDILMDICTHESFRSCVHVETCTCRNLHTQEVMCFLTDTCTKKTCNFFLSKWHICGGDKYCNNCKTTWMMMEMKNYFLLELYICLHLALQKLLDDMVGLHLNNQKNCWKISNKAMNKFTMITINRIITNNY